LFFIFRSADRLTNDPPPDVALALFIFAFFVTSYRCLARYTKKLWWHDDSVALFSALSFIVFFIGSYNICFRLAARRTARADDFSSVSLGSTLLADGIFLRP
jgi:hypothetical protein